MKHIRFTQSPTNITNHQEKYYRRNREVDDRRNRDVYDKQNREEEDRDNRRNQDEDTRIEGRNREDEKRRDGRNREDEKRITKEEKFGFLKDVPVIKYIIIVLIILFVIYICYKLYIHFTKKTSEVIIDDIKIEKYEDSDLLDINSDSDSESVIDDDDVGGIDDIIIKGTKTGLPIANMRYVYF